LNIEGAYSFKTDREKLWASLLNPDVLASCIPGCEKFEPTGEDAYDVVLKVKIAAISGMYSGRIVIADKRYLDSYKMLVEGQGAGGTVRGEGVLSFSDISDSDGGTEIKIVGEAHVTGVVARVGQRLMGSASKLLMSQFFGCLKDKIEG